MRTFALGLVCVLAVVGCKKKQEVASKAPPAAPVKLGLVAVTEAKTPVQLVLTGMVTADQRAEVTADTAGKVLGVMVERGQRVKMGQEIVRLDVRTAALSAREANANLATARAQRQLAQEECRRAKELLDKGAITKSEWDRENTQCTSALQQVSAAEARTAMISKSVADGIVRAPFEGVVAQRSVTPGEWVVPGRSLITLVDDKPLRIELSVPEAAVRAIALKQRVELVAVAYPDKKYSAIVTRIGAEIGRTRSLTVEATIDPGSDLVPGMFAEAMVEIDHKLRAVVPADAVVKRGKLWHAFVVVKGEAQDRIVHLGPDPAPGQRSILQGVAKGDKVVAKVTEQVVDGLRVTE